MSIFDKYASKINADDLKASQQEIQANANGGGNREEVPVGKYEVKVDKLECKMSKSNNLMVSIWFRIMTGKFEKSVIFYNGVFNQDWMRHRVADMLTAIICGVSGDYDFTIINGMLEKSGSAMRIDTVDQAKALINLLLKSNNMQVINDFCMDIHESIDGRLEYLLDYGLSKGYNTYAIEEVFDAE
jgi:hypothetical protein